MAVKSSSVGALKAPLGVNGTIIFGKCNVLVTDFYRIFFFQQHWYILQFDEAIRVPNAIHKTLQLTQLYKVMIVLFAVCIHFQEKISA